MKQSVVIEAVCWTARITGTAMVLLVLIFIAGSLMEVEGKPATAFSNFTIIIFIIWGAGLAALILAWWKENIGGWISLFCFVLFNILIGVDPTPGSSYSYVLLLFPVPSVLYLLAWYLNRKVPAS